VRALRSTTARRSRKAQVLRSDLFEDRKILVNRRWADQQVLVGRPVRKRWDRDSSVEIVQYFAAVFARAVKSRRGGETDRLKVLEEQADLARGRAACAPCHRPG
jgi:hypothetical protein